MSYRAGDNRPRANIGTGGVPVVDRRPRRDQGEPRHPWYTDGRHVESMRGRVVRYDRRSGYGVISGGDGMPYGFYAEEWQEPAPPVPGLEVDFYIRDGLAIGVTRLATTSTRQRKSRGTAAALAILFGWLGVHKFYLGYTGPGFLVLFGFVLSFLLWIVGIGLIITVAIIVIAVIEFFLYLSKSDEEFHQTYVVNRRAWF